MEHKKALEAFRVRQFSGPHPALSAGPSASEQPGADPLGVQLVPDHERVIIHFDVDCFYAQVEECRNPSLRGKPLAVTQKYLVVTANYAARAAGVTKLMGIADAKRACPQLVLVPGEDLTPYRAASRDIRVVLSRWGPTEKLGLDESWVDVTAEVDRRLAAAQAASTTATTSSSAWSGHLVSSSLQLTSHSRHRPMDLRAVQQQAGDKQTGVCSQGQQPQQPDQHQQPASSHPSKTEAPAAGAGAAAGAGDGGVGGRTAHHTPDAAAAPSWLPVCELRLRLGAVVAAEMRQAVKQETGFRCSAGISCSKLLSKLVSGLHKPDDQTSILPTQAQAFVAPLPLRALPGVGYKADGLLKSWGVATAADARAISKQQLVTGLGDKHGAGLFHACRGVDPSPVVASGPPKSITVEDSFKACSSWQGVAQVLQVLIPDLLDRLQEDAQEFPQLQRNPSTLTVKWRKSGTGWARSSASTAWPAAARLKPAQQQPASGSLQQQQQLGAGTHAAVQQQTPAGAVPAGGAIAVAALAAAATSLLKQHLPASGFSLTLLNIGATGFKSRAGPGGDILQLLAKQQPQAAAALSKQQQQAAAAAAAAAASVAAACTNPHPSDTLLPNQPPLGPAAGLAGADLLRQARAATEARRDYSRASSCAESPCRPQPTSRGQGQAPSSVPGAQQDLLPGAASSVGAAGGGMMSKRQERRLWELAMQQQQEQQHMQDIQNTPAAGASCVWPPQQPQQQQQQGSSKAAGTSAPQQNLQASPSQQPRHRPHATGDSEDERPQSPKRQRLLQEGAAMADVVLAAVPPAAARCGSSGAAGEQHSVSGAQPAVVCVTEADLAASTGASWLCTSLHSVEGWGLVACEVLEEFEDACGEPE